MAISLLRGRIYIHDIVYWPPGKSDNYGKPSFGLPVSIKGRWDEEIQSRIMPDGRTWVSKANVMVDREVELNGVLFKGSLQSNTPLTDGDDNNITDGNGNTRTDGGSFGESTADPFTLQAYEIKEIEFIDTIRGDQTLRVAYL